MWWLVPVASAVMNGLQAEKQRKAQIEDNKLQAELTKYSPWTGQFGKISPVGGGFMDGAMQGAMSGLSLSQNMMKAGMIDGPKKAKPVEVSPTANEPIGWSTLEGSKYLEQPQLGSPVFTRRSYLGV